MFFHALMDLIEALSDNPSCIIRFLILIDECCSYKLDDQIGDFENEDGQDEAGDFSTKIA